MNDPDKTILASLLVAAGILTWRGIREHNLSPRTYAAFGVVAFMLLALGSFAPDLAAAFAVLVLVVVLLSSQTDIASLVSVGQEGR